MGMECLGELGCVCSLSLSQLMAVSSFHTLLMSSDHNLSVLHSQSSLLSTEQVLTLCREKEAQGASAVPLGTSSAPPQRGQPL